VLHQKQIQSLSVSLFICIYYVFVVLDEITAPVLFADYVTTRNGLKMASTAACNLRDNHRHSIANFNFNLTVLRLQQLNILLRKQAKCCRK